MSEELTLGQRELTVEASLEELSNEEKDLILFNAFQLMRDILEKSGTQTLSTLLGELAQNAAIGLDKSAKPLDMNAAPQNVEAV